MRQTLFTLAASAALLATSSAVVPAQAAGTNDRDLIPNEVLIEVANSVSDQIIDALRRRHRLTRLESQRFEITGITLYRWRISDRRSVANVVRELRAETVVASVQPNYRFTLQ